jgi:hypothetical protein
MWHHMTPHDIMWQVPVKIQVNSKYYIKLSSGSVYKVYMKHKSILCLDLSPIPKIADYAYANTTKIIKYPQILNTLVWSKLGNRHGNCIEERVTCHMNS